MHFSNVLSRTWIDVRTSGPDSITPCRRGEVVEDSEEEEEEEEGLGGLSRTSGSASLRSPPSVDDDDGGNGTSLTVRGFPPGENKR